MGDTVTENDKGWVRPMTEEELRCPVLGRAVRELLVVLAIGTIVIGLVTFSAKEPGVYVLALSVVFLATLGEPQELPHHSV